MFKMKNGKKCTETNASTRTIAYSNQNNATVDDCIKFCLEKARDDKNNSDMYLRIIKHLLDKMPVEWHYHQQPYYPSYPNITYTNNNKSPDLDLNKVYCDVKKDQHEYSVTSTGVNNESITC